MSARRWIILGWIVWSLVATHRYSAVWVSNGTLWTHAMRVTPLNPRAHLNYAIALGGMSPEAHYHTAVAMALKRQGRRGRNASMDSSSS